MPGGERLSEEVAKVRTEVEATRGRRRRFLACDRSMMFREGGVELCVFFCLKCMCVTTVLSIS